MKVIMIVIWAKGMIGATSQQIEYSTLAGCEKDVAKVMALSENVWATCLEPFK